MNKKIFVIFICSIMICLLFQPFVSADLINIKKILDDDVPIWEVGDKWVYKINEFNIYFSMDKGSINLKTSDLIFEVTNVTSNMYVVNFELKLSGVFNIMDRGLNLKFGGLKPILISGKIEYNKSDLGIKNIDTQISGIFKLRFKKIPFLSFNLNINLNLDSSNPIKLISFPIAVEKYWGINSTNLTVNGYIRSPWLTLINFVHNIIRFLNRFINLIPEQYMKYSGILAGILPIIDIKETLSMFNMSNIFFIEGIYEPIFECVDNEQIIVQGNTFDCYNISLGGMDGGIANIYYSPEIGNIAKFYIKGDFLTDIINAYLEIPLITEISDINIELISTN